MNSSEASGDVQPRSTMKRRGLKEGEQYNNIWPICILFVIIIILFTNNFMIYRAYNEIYRRFVTTHDSLNYITAAKFHLDIEKQIITEENERLKADNLTILAQNDKILKQFEEIKRINEELSTINGELIEDNIALQNTLKMAASSGIKPQNYTAFNELNHRGDLDRGNYIGKFHGTAYTPSADECGNNLGITNSGKPIIPGISVAVDKNYWPFGTVFYIKGLGYAVAMDTGGSIKGKYRFDFAVFDKNFARTLGSREWDVYLVRMGNGRVNEIDL